MPLDASLDWRQRAIAAEAALAEREERIGKLKEASAPLVAWVKYVDEPTDPLGSFSDDDRASIVWGTERFTFGHLRALASALAQPDREPGSKSRHAAVAASFAAYLASHPEERFWQALRNWSGAESIGFGKRGESSMRDTFHWEGMAGFDREPGSQGAEG